MTNQQGAPEALRLAAEVLDWMPTSDTQRALWDRHQEALAVVNAALVEAQQPAPSAAAAVGEVEPVFWMNEKGHTWSHSDWKQFPKHRAKYPIPLYAHRPAPQPSPTPQADSQPAPVREEERKAFKAAHRHLELDEVPDAWGRPTFKHSHVEASWLGWIARAASAPADSVTAPAGGAEEVDKALNDYAQAFMARAMGWTREHGDAMPDARTKLYSAISSYARGLSTTSPTPQADSQPGDKDLVAVPRDIIGAACSAIDKKRDGAKTLAELRRYTVGDLSAAITSAPQADSVLEDVGRANWQDISTAPKDGTRFVAVGNNYGLYSEAQHTCIAQWFRGCWMDVSEWNETSELKYLTHWMPLLPLPGSAARKQGGANG